MSSGSYSVFFLTILVVYLVGLGFFLEEIGKDINIQYTQTGASFTPTGALISNSSNFQCDCGVETCQEYGLINGQQALNELCNQQALQGTQDTGIVGNIVTGVQSLPTWINVIFITIPVALLVLIIIIIFIHGF